MERTENTGERAVGISGRVASSWAAGLALVVAIAAGLWHAQRDPEEPAIEPSISLGASEVTRVAPPAVLDKPVQTAPMPRGTRSRARRPNAQTNTPDAPITPTPSPTEPDLDAPLPH